MYIFLIIVHVLVCLFLISVILLQAGRGSGMSEMWGGGQPQSLFGTQTNVFMTRVTEVCAVLFIVTSLSLGILTTQRGKSLVERQHAMNDFKRAASLIPPGTEQPKPAETPAAAPAPAEAAPAASSESAAPSAS